METEEAQRLLTAAGHPALYPKNRRDAACLFALINKIGVVQLNEMLSELEEPIL